MIGGDDLSTLTGKVSEKKHAAGTLFLLTSTESLQEKIEKLSLRSK